MFLVLALWVSAAFAADAQSGHSVYTAKCQACHGADGKGDGPAAAALPAHPPDFTSADFWKGMTDDHLTGIISGGKANGVMKPFPMTPAQMADLVAWLHTYQPKP